MDSFSFLMIKARLEYYEDMISRMQKEERLRPPRKRPRKEKKASPLFRPSTAHALRCPLEEAHE
jgi:hypothetical protein